MNFKDFLIEKSGGVRKVVVVYGGGFQPFHQGHMSSYEQAKKSFSKSDFYVASSSDVKVRPIPFEDKKFLAQQAGVTDHIVQTKSPLNPSEITEKYDPEKDILILVRSERDPVPYTKKDGSPAYYQPFVSLAKCKPFGEHGYIFVTKKKVFKIGNEEVYSGSQIRKMYASADNAKREEIINSLYPRALKPKKIKSLLDKYLIIKEDINLEFSELLSEGVHDKGIFKAVFLSGGPGSGKDYVLDNTLSGHGLTEINSDKALEFLMDKEGLDKRMPDSEKEIRDLVRGRAKNVTELKQRLALLGRNGLIINGTGDDVDKIKKIKERLEKLGYETSMIAVNTADEISKKRNIERGQRGGRTVPEDVRKQKWDAVQNARPEMAKIFGQNYTEFDNSEDLRTAAPEVVKAKREEMLEIFKKVKEFTSRPVKNETAQQWISNELHSKDTLGVSKKGAELTAHPESEAYQEAMKMGLNYYGFGRYGKDGKITHHSIHDKLVPITKVKPPAELKMPVAGSSAEKKKVNENFNQLFEQVTIHITADTAEEAEQALHLIKSEPVEENIQFSDTGARNLLTLGSNRTPEMIHQQSVNRWQEMVKETMHKQQEKFLKNGEGKTRIFTLRKSAAEEAHQNGGEVVKQGKGYVVKLKENTNVRLDKESLHSKITMGKGRLTEESACCTSCDTIDKNGGNHGNKEETSTKGTKSTKGSRYTKEAKEEINEIDYGTEVGMPLAGYSKEKLDKKGRAGQNTSDSLKELTGDETTMSIGDQKENELRRKGIYLSTFKAKKFV